MVSQPQPGGPRGVSDSFRLEERLINTGRTCRKDARAAVVPSDSIFSENRQSKRKELQPRFGRVFSSWREGKMQFNDYMTEYEESLILGYAMLIVEVLYTEYM